MTSLILSINENIATMSSREIAELTGKQHKHVMIDAGKMLIALGEDEPTFRHIYFDSMNREQREYRLTKEFSITLVAGYSVVMRHAIIKRWQDLETKITHNIPTSLSAALRLAADQSEQIEAQQAQLAIAAPKVAFVDRYVESTGFRGFREVCKLLGANESRFSEFLTNKKIMYRLGSKLMPHSPHMDAGRFVVKTGTSEEGHAFNTAKFTAKGVEWIAGLWAVHGLKEAE
jgi:phage antirepressor YoqD-like protein